MDQRKTPVNEENAQNAEDRRCVNQSQSSSPARSTAKIIIMMINSRQYELGEMLGKGGYGKVYEGRRVEDDLKVAVKIVEKELEEPEDVRYTTIPDHPKPIPMEIALHILANKEPRAPEIIQLLDWEEQRDRYVMVLEDFTPCMDMFQYLRRNGKVDEDLAKVVMRSAITAARECSERGVFHRDIKLDNLLINTDTQEVKLIDFGCGDLLKNSAYKTYMGTHDYTCPEYDTLGEYYADQATVYSLGVTLFIMVCGQYPRFNDRRMISTKTFQKKGLSEECCDFIQACMQECCLWRIRMEYIFEHKWFQERDSKMSASLGCSALLLVGVDFVQNPVSTWISDFANLTKRVDNNMNVTNESESPGENFPESDRREGLNTIRTIGKVTRDYRSSSSDISLS